MHSSRYAASKQRIIGHIILLTADIYGKSRPLTKEEREQKREEKRARKKERMKALFNAEYDDRGGSKTFYEEWKAEMEQQAQVFLDIH